jgi:hypothetical protein
MALDQKITASVLSEACITLKNSRHGMATSKGGRKQNHRLYFKAAWSSLFFAGVFHSRSSPPAQTPKYFSVLKTLSVCE